MAYGLPTRPHIEVTSIAPLSSPAFHGCFWCVLSSALPPTKISSGHTSLQADDGSQLNPCSWHRKHLQESMSATSMSFAVLVGGFEGAHIRGWLMVGTPATSIGTAKLLPVLHHPLELHVEESSAVVEPPPEVRDLSAPSLVFSHILHCPNHGNLKQYTCPTLEQPWASCKYCEHTSLACHISLGPSLGSFTKHLVDWRTTLFRPGDLGEVIAC